MDIPRFALGAARRGPTLPLTLATSFVRCIDQNFSCVPQKSKAGLHQRIRAIGRNVMRLLGKLGLAVVACLFGAKLTAAETTVKWLHIEANPAQVKIWEEVARAYEGSHPGVKVEMQFLENEAYKAKLPTILQSKDRPNIIYSWAGGVLKTQIEAGVLDDITDSVKDYSDNLTPAALAAFTSNGRVYGLPTALSQVGFLCNNELMAKGRSILPGSRAGTICLLP